MRRSAELELRLTEWADAYRGGKYEDIGYPSRSWLYNAMLYQGPSPQGLHPRGVRDKTPADEVEEAVMHLEKQQGGFRAGRVLRAEYWMRHASEEQKLRALRYTGFNMGRVTYYDQLWVARVHVAAWLHIPASVDLPQDVA
jgi:hypothetical protein